MKSLNISRVCRGSLALVLPLLSAPAVAQPEGGDTPTEKAIADSDVTTEKVGDVGAADSDVQAEEQPEGQGDVSAEMQEQIDAAALGQSAAELPGETYLFVGARFRLITVPKFMLNMFAEGGQTVNIPNYGLEFIVRKDGFEYNMGLSWADYSIDGMDFKSSTEPDDAWEIIDSELGILYLQNDFMWSNEFSPEFSLIYGTGVGLGFVFGDLVRTEAYRNGDEILPCSGPGFGAPGVAEPGYCDDQGDHYNGYTEPSWADGGSKAILFPWLALQTGFRYKPTRDVVTRLDLGFGTSGFFIGLGADYGL